MVVGQRIKSTVEMFGLFIANSKMTSVLSTDLALLVKFLREVGKGAFSQMANSQ